MSVLKHKKKWIVAVIFFVAIAVLIAVNHLLNTAFYYPESPERQVTPFKVSTLLLAPSVHYTHEDHSHGRPHLFGTSELSFSFSKLVDAYLGQDKKQLQNEGKMRFAFGKARVSYTDEMKIGQLTHTQGFFRTGKNLVSWKEIQPDQQYEAYLGFSGPISLTEAIHSFETLFYYPYDQNNQQLGGVSWIPILTSEQPDDISIGTIGSYHPPLFSVEAFSSAFEPNAKDNNRSTAQIESHFRESLFYAAEYQEEAKIYLNSGLFPGAENLTFADRLAFIEANPILCTGLVVQAKGDLLLSYQDSKDLFFCGLPTRQR